MVREAARASREGRSTRAWAEGPRPTGRRRGGVRRARSRRRRRRPAAAQWRGGGGRGGGGGGAAVARAAGALTSLRPHEGADDTGRTCVRALGPDLAAGRAGRLHGGAGGGRGRRGVRSGRRGCRRRGRATRPPEPRGAVAGGGRRAQISRTCPPATGPTPGRGGAAAGRGARPARRRPRRRRGRRRGGDRPLGRRTEEMVIPWRTTASTSKTPGVTLPTSR